MHNSPLDEDSFLNQIIQQWDQAIVKSLLDRIFIEAGIQPSCSCSFMAREQATDQEI